MKVLGVAQEGDGFGELSFVTGKPRAVGARAATHSHLLTFDSELFGLLFASVPERKVAILTIAILTMPERKVAILTMAILTMAILTMAYAVGRGRRTP